MNGFIAIAGLLTLAALVALLYPLLRKREGSPEAWRSGGIAALLIAAGRGRAVSAVEQLQLERSRPRPLDSPAAMVGRLARRLEKQPDDLPGWLQLGRSYTVLEEYPLAVARLRARQHACQRAERRSGRWVWPKHCSTTAAAICPAGRAACSSRRWSWIRIPPRRCSTARWPRASATICRWPGSASSACWMPIRRDNVRELIEEHIKAAGCRRRR